MEYEDIILDSLPDDEFGDDDDEIEETEEDAGDKSEEADDSDFSLSDDYDSEV